jgi:hypothetical protein
LEVFMLVPAIAFSWWLASVPMGKAPTQPPSIAAATVARTQHLPASPGAASLAAQAGPAVSNDRLDPATDDPAATEPTAEDGAEPTGERVLYRGLITPAIVRQAREYLDLPMGAERSADVEGHHFVFVLERHYHPPGFVGAPNGWHKGVTVYEQR